MKRLLFSFLLCFITACNGTVPVTPSGTDNSQPAVEVTSSPTLPQKPTHIPTIQTNLSTEPVVQTATPILFPCDPYNNYCIAITYFYLARPIALPGTITIDRGYPYGSTEGGTRDPHHGVEFYNASGTPVLAAADGQVVVAGDDNQAIYALNPNTYGNLIVIEHQFEERGKPVFTLYGHLSKVEVRIGQTVHSGEEIGQVGATGAAIGSHLHFEVRLGQDNYDSNRNPVLWLKPLTDDLGKAEGILAGRLEDAQGKLIHTAGLNIQYFPDLKGPQAAAWQVETYAPEKHPVRGDDVWNENFVLGDIPAGNYRISLIRGGELYERWFEVLPGQITFFILRIDQ